MSWGAGEFSAELGYDSHFVARGVHFFAASGDAGGVVIYPSASPTVIACGGTALSLDSNGGYGSEAAWGGGGGGMSSQEPLPRFQALLRSYDSSGHRIVVTSRSTPDIAAVADPGTGVSVYDSFGGERDHLGCSRSTGYTGSAGSSTTSRLEATALRPALDTTSAPAWGRRYP